MAKITMTIIITSGITMNPILLHNHVIICDLYYHKNNNMCNNICHVWCMLGKTRVTKH
jgi:hypothetical protein